MKIYVIEANEYSDAWMTYSEHGFFLNKQSAEETVQRLNALAKIDWEATNQDYYKSNIRRMVEYDALVSLGIDPSFDRPLETEWPEFEDEYRVGEFDVIED